MYWIFATNGRMFTAPCTQGHVNYLSLRPLLEGALVVVSGGTVKNI